MFSNDRLQRSDKWYCSLLIVCARIGCEEWGEQSGNSLAGTIAVGEETKIRRSVAGARLREDTE